MSSTQSVGSSPLKRGLGGTASGNYTHRSVDSIISADVEETQCHISAADFVANAFHYPSLDDAILAVEKLNVKADLEYSTLLERYNAALYERDRYEPFCELMNLIVTKAAEKISLPHPAPKRSKFTALGNTVLGGDVARRKPDMVVLPEDTEKKLAWAHPTVVIEMKTRRKRSTAAAHNSASSSVGRKRKSDSENTSGHSKRSRASSGHATQTSLPEPNVSHPDSPPVVPSRSQRSGKAKSRSGKESRAPDRRLSAKAQLASYAIEAMSSLGCRRFVLGMLIKDHEIQLTYYDRGGSVISDIFDIHNHFGLFALAVIGCSCANYEILGFESTIRPCFGDAVVDVDLMETSPESLKGARMDIPPQTKWYDDQGVDFEIPKNSGIILKEALDIRPGFVGRGTTVYVARISVPDEHQIPGFDPKEELVVKLSWQVCTRAHEEAFILEGRRSGLLDVVPHVPKVRLAFVANVKLSTMSGVRKHAQGSYEDRELRIMVSRRYKPLYCLKDLDQFKSAFKSIVKCHHALCTEPKLMILHRDISESNVMYDYQDPGNPGILNDFDLAIKISDPKREASAKHRTGTAPFMSLELLHEKGVSVTHRQVHDLESFFYVLVWISVLYNYGERVKQSLLKPWARGKWMSIYKAKRLYFLQSTGDWDNLVAQVSEQYRPLLNSWLEPFWQHILLALNRAEADLALNRANAEEHPEAPPYTDHIRYEAIWAILKHDEKVKVENKSSALMQFQVGA